MSRNKYPEETVKRILDVAQRLFLEKGYENTSIQDIIDGLGGLSKGAVYHHFRSKEDIFNAVGDRYNERVVEELREVRDDKTLSGYGKLTEYPRELSEVIVLLANIWLNPLVIRADLSEMEGRVRFFNELLCGMGLDLLDDEMLESYIRYCRLSRKETP